ncbi:MAG: AAA family ATPase [Bacteroidetes bacterium]|nr:AAA family ATPase [Bacteroidota bacterium]
MENPEKQLNPEQASEWINAIRTVFNAHIAGQPEVADLLTAALLAEGHVLIEGVPGLGKTWAVRLLSRCLDLSFSRIQFTPDLMPSDIVGTPVFVSAEKAFEFRPGPVFAQLVLIDEVNRAPAKTQSALFEVMEEKQVTVDGVTRPMARPFMVIATQNPVDHEGTYRLPEAELDRFLFNILISYPPLEEETRLLLETLSEPVTDRIPKLKPVIGKDQLIALKAMTQQVHASEELIGYLVRLVRLTRETKDIFLGGSPRAALALLSAARASAVMNGRDFITPDDIKSMALPVLRHRILLTAEAELEGKTPDQVLKNLLHQTEVPR